LGGIISFSENYFAANTWISFKLELQKTSGSTLKKMGGILACLVTPNLKNIPGGLP